MGLGVFHCRGVSEMLKEMHSLGIIIVGSGTLGSRKFTGACVTIQICLESDVLIGAHWSISVANIANLRASYLPDAISQWTSRDVNVRVH